jgi:hypothetical protein
MRTRTEPLRRGKAGSKKTRNRDRRRRDLHTTSISKDSLCGPAPTERVAATPNRLNGSLRHTTARPAAVSPTAAAGERRHGSVWKVCRACPGAQFMRESGLHASERLVKIGAPYGNEIHGEH